MRQIYKDERCNRTIDYFDYSRSFYVDQRQIISEKVSLFDAQFITRLLYLIILEINYRKKMIDCYVIFIETSTKYTIIYFYHKVKLHICLKIMIHTFTRSSGVTILRKSIFLPMLIFLKYSFLFCILFYIKIIKC